MPAPLKPGYNFHYDRQLREFHYEMSCADSYTDFYGISFMISGERLVFSPELTTVINTGNRPLSRKTSVIALPTSLILLTNVS